MPILSFRKLTYTGYRESTVFVSSTRLPTDPSTAVPRSFIPPMPTGGHGALSIGLQGRRRIIPLFPELAGKACT
jgi:hypothetical protein